MRARATQSVMIMIGPAESQFVLATFLNLRRAIAPLPISAFLGKDHVASKVTSEQRDHIYLTIREFLGKNGLPGK